MATLFKRLWRVSRADEPDRALKILRRLSQTTYDRLTAEITALRMTGDIAGVVPLIEQELPRDPEKGPRWFVMPLAEPRTAILHGLQPMEIVAAFVPLAETLALLHDRGIHHRDIKPANLLSLDARLGSASPTSVSSNIPIAKTSRRHAPT